MRYCCTYSIFFQPFTTTNIQGSPRYMAIIKFEKCKRFKLGSTIKTMGKGKRGRQSASRKKSILKRAGVSKINAPKRTPNGAKSHVVVTVVHGKYKTIRFGEQGAKTNRSAKQRKAFKSRHLKNIRKGRSIAAYWANKVKWKPPRKK